MSSTTAKTHHLRFKRARRVRKQVRGSAERPRLCLVKTNRYLHAQLIDDENGVTLAAYSTASKAAKEANLSKKSVENAGKSGELFGKMLTVKKIIFDRGASKYHGRVAAFAEGVRKSGIEF